MRGHVHDRPSRDRRERGEGVRLRLRIHAITRPWVGPVHAHQASLRDASAGGDRYEDQEDLHAHVGSCGEAVEAVQSGAPTGH